MSRLLFLDPPSSPSPIYYYSDDPPTPIDTSHPFYRSYANIMGQAHPRGTAGGGGVKLEVSPSTGPDPTVFRQHPRYPNVHIVSPSLSIPRAGHDAVPKSEPKPKSSPTSSAREGSLLSGSAALPLSQQSYRNSAVAGRRTSRTLAIPVPLPKPSGFSSKPKIIGRKLSRNRKAPSIQTKKSMGPDPFEARPFSPSLATFDPVELLGAASVQSGHGGASQSTVSGSQNVKADTFPPEAMPDERFSTSDLTSSSGTIPFPTAKPSPVISSPYAPLSSATRPLRPIGGTHRHPSHASTRSTKYSLKSSPSKRAEREWRAKVAGLASLNRSPVAGGVSAGTRGPVPPRRAPANVGLTSATRRSPSPEDDQVITPTSPAPSTRAPEEGKGTPAKSFASNRSFETLGHHAHHPVGATLSTASPGTRQCSVPRSVVSSFYFDNRTSRVSTHLSPVMQSQSTLPAATVTTRSAVSNHGAEPHRSPLPPFSSFHLSPASVGPSHSPRPEFDSQRPLLPTVPGARRVDSSSGSDPMTPLKPQSGGLATSQSSTSSGPRPLTPTRSDALPSTPVQQTHTHLRPVPSGPGTPYSPTTAYILEADNIDASHHLFAGDIDLSSYDPELKTGSRSRHPYARTSSMMIDSPPKAPLESRRTMPLALAPRREAFSPSLASRCQTPVYLNPAPRRTGIKADAVGSKETSSGYGAGGSTILSNKRVDLTPGMETGLRPPKSGLPVADLERWLASTVISD